MAEALLENDQDGHSQVARLLAGYVASLWRSEEDVGGLTVAVSRTFTLTSPQAPEWSY